MVAGVPSKIKKVYKLWENSIFQFLDWSLTSNQK
jgi:hypothetical protein